MGTDDGGRHWTDLSTTPLRLVELAFTSPSQGWLLALRCGDANQAGPCAAHVLVTADSGHTWRDTMLPLQARDVDLSHPTATDGWVAASLGAPSQPPLIASHDSGRAWQPLPNPGPGFEQRVFFRDAKQGWLLAGGEPGAGAQMKELFGTVDGGHTWTKLAWTGGFGQPGSVGTGGLPAGGYVGQVVFPTAQDGWIASPRGALLHSADGGKTWHPAAIDAHFFSAVGFVTAQVGWAVSVEGPAVWLTGDAGRTWRAGALPG